MELGLSWGALGLIYMLWLTRRFRQIRCRRCRNSKSLSSYIRENGAQFDAVRRFLCNRV